MLVKSLLSTARSIIFKIRSYSLQISIYCGIVSLALLSFDECPAIVFWVFPHRPSYFISLVGIVFFVASDSFPCALLRTWKLIAFVMGMVVWGAIGTLMGSFDHCNGEFCTFFIDIFVAWRIIPLAIMLWFAMMFSSLPINLSKKYFTTGLLLLFTLNSIHMSLEILSNFGAYNIKHFLITINHYFRQQEIGHGWWPPIYFEGRVRGFFAEPSHMSSTLLALFGVFLYKSNNNKIYYLLFLFLLLCYIASKSYSGLISLACFLVIVGVIFFARHISAWKKLQIISLIVCFSFSIFLFYFMNTRLFKDIVLQYDNAKSISSYCTSFYSNNQKKFELTKAEDGKLNAFNRIASFLLDIDIAKKFPLGIGYVQRGFYWDCLQNVDLSDFEIGLWVKESRGDTHKGIPQLSEFGSLTSEQGFVGLALFTSFYLYVVLSSYSFATKHKDRFVFYMASIYACMSITLFFVPLSNFFLFYYLSGFLCAINLTDKLHVNYVPQTRPLAPGDHSSIGTDRSACG